VPNRPLTERESEVLSFLLSAPDLPSAEALRLQAAVATTSGPCCPCGCATIDLIVDHSVAPQARIDLRYDLVQATTDDIDRVNRSVRLRLYGEGGELDPTLRVTEDTSGTLWLILFVEDGWLSALEIASVGDFMTPEVFPPADLFDAPEVTSERPG
jgi:hypothetical protein